MKNKLTLQGCCDTVSISSGNTIVMFGTHRFIVNVHYCKTCGSLKSTSNIQEQK